MYFGLDKVVIGNIALVGADLGNIERLAREFKGIRLEKDENGLNHGIKELSIIDEDFGILTCGYKMEHGRYIPYVIIDINKSRVESNNLIPHSVETFRDVYLPKLKRTIKKMYGLDLDFGEVNFKAMEINCTFPLNENYSNYDRVFNFMMYNAPKTYKLRDTRAEHSTGVTTYYLKNKSVEVKIYNKLLELDKLGNSHNMNENMCRIEYKLYNKLGQDHNTEKIKDVFGTARVREISTEDLKEFFLAQFERDFVKPTEKAIKEQEKLVAKKLKEKKGVNRQYIYKTAIELLANNQLLDVEQLYKAIKKIDKVNYRRTIGNFKKDMSDIEVLTNNLARLEEIKEKIKGIELI